MYSQFHTDTCVRWVSILTGNFNNRTNAHTIVDSGKSGETTTITMQHSIHSWCMVYVGICVHYGWKIIGFELAGMRYSFQIFTEKCRVCFMDFFFGQVEKLLSISLRILSEIKSYDHKTILATTHSDAKTRGTIGLCILRVSNQM